MLPLAATNAVGAVLFGALYASAAAGHVPQILFLPGLALVFALVTGLWVRGEARSRCAGAARRVVRTVVALAAVIVGVPALTLAPLFWLSGQLPPEAGFDGLLASSMTILLAALAMVVVVNLLGAVIVVARGLAGRSPPAA